MSFAAEPPGLKKRAREEAGGASSSGLAKQRRRGVSIDGGAGSSGGGRQRSGSIGGPGAPDGATTTLRSRDAARKLEADMLATCKDDPHELLRYRHYRRAHFDARHVETLMAAAAAKAVGGGRNGSGGGGGGSGGGAPQQRVSLNRHVGTIMGGVLKLFVQKVVEGARAVAAERGHVPGSGGAGAGAGALGSGKAAEPLQPEHLREAYQRLKDDGQLAYCPPAEGQLR
jgi:hypothetical protein